MDKTEQNAYLVSRGYQTNDDLDSDGGLFGLEWNNPESGKFVAISWKGKVFGRVEYRILGDDDCFNFLKKLPASLKFKKHSRTLDEYECEYVNYKGKKYVLTFVKWDSEAEDGPYYYQIRVSTHKYFNKVELPDQREQPLEITNY